MGKKATLGPDAFIKLYENWANENKEYRKNRYGDPIVPHIDNMSRSARERFASYLFANGAFMKKANGQFFAEELNENDHNFLMLVLRNR